jgi:hypothetical protein
VYLLVLIVTIGLSGIEWMSKFCTLAVLILMTHQPQH